jgi:glutathione S-transferase
MSITLYFAERSSALPALVGLEEAEVDFEAVRLVLPKGEQRSDAYRAIYPRGRVPAVAIDGLVIGENLGVLTAIAFTFPEARLLPLADPLKLARAYELMGWFATTVHVAFSEIFRPERYTAEQSAWPALAAGGLDQAAAAYDEIESILADGRPWLLGDRFSLVDPYAVVFWRWAERVGIETAAYPAFAAHAARILDRPATKRALLRETGAATPLNKSLEYNSINAAAV